MEKQLAYWKQQLGGDLPVLELPADSPRPAMQTYRGARRMMALPPALLAGLQALSRQEDSTLFMTLLAAFKTLLYRYTAQTDIIVGSTVANRNQAEMDPLMGFFANTLVLRTPVTPTAAFRELLAQVKEVALEAYAHQNVPFEVLVEKLQPARDTSRSPLFQVLFILQNTPLRPTQRPDLTLRPVDVDPETARFDLMVMAWEDPRGSGELVVSFEYNADLFAPATMARLMAHYRVLLEGIVAHPDSRLIDLPLLTEVERQQMLVTWNETAVAYPRTRCLPDLFADQVARTPQKTALVFENQTLTYEELDRRANRLAHTLRTLGVGADTLVGVGVERSLEMVVGLLAILKAGGAYVPLDPAFPAGRLAYMVADAGLRVLLTQQHLLDMMPTAPEMAVVCLDRDWPAIARQPGEAPPVAVQPHHLAYVIYTSGSTGRPKGVQIPQQAVANFLAAMRQTPGLTAADVLLSVTTLSFDISVLELFLPLTTGAQVVLVDRETAAGGRRLVQALHDSGATVMQATPTTWRMLVDAGWPGDGQLQALCGGEALPRDLAHEVAARCGTLWNMYGPTETTVWSAVYKVQHGAGSVSIGRPIANTQLYVLDAHLRPVPVGVAGELYIGGDGLARGYLHRPRLTATRFVPDPFSQAPGARLYRTGDLVRYLPDGNIAFISRVDHQVKVRGFRIELGEIESVLVGHTAVHEGVVIVREDVAGDKRLVAYLIPAENQPPPTAGDLRRFMQQTLPDYMVPATFVFLDAFPLTPNKKVDRKALPAPQQTRPELTQDFVAPRNAVEKTVAAIWEEVLRLEKVGICDDFFELGGHSLLATQVISRLRQHFPVPPSLSCFFAEATIAALAAEIQSKQQETTLPPAPPLQPTGGKDKSLPLSFAQQRLWFWDRLVPETPLYNMPLLFQIEGNLDIALLQKCLYEIVRRHEALRTIFEEENGRPQQVILPPQPVPLVHKDLRPLSRPGRQRKASRLAQEEAQRPFNLATGPLLRALLLQLDDHSQRLLLTVHHIAFDGWSTGLIMEELAALYEAFVQNRPSPLAELPLQYADFARWQRQQLPLQDHLAYWLAQFSGEVPVLALPTDQPRPATPSYGGARVTRTLPDALLQKVERLSRHQNATLFMTLLAAWQALLSRYSGQTDVVVGAPIAGRTRPEIEKLVGFFVNTLPLRVDLGGNPSVAEIIGRVRQVALDAYTHQELPLEKLVEEVGVERQLSHNPLFQVVFAVQNMPLRPIQLAGATNGQDAGRGLHISFGGEMGTGTAKFDLLLTVEFPETGMEVIAEYSRDLFTAETIHRLLAHYQTVLQAIAADPGQRLSDLPMLTARERTQLLQTWNATQTAYPRHATIQQLFAAQVAQTPQAIALTCQGQHLTYEALNRRANRLAHLLRERGIGPEVMVGLYLARSLDMVIATLAILKAGGAYVPIDPAYPPERINFILQDTQAPVLLTHHSLTHNLPATAANVDIICLDRDQETIAAAPAGNPASGATAVNLAYVMYTSGSTGRPKGVAVTHRSVARLVKNTNYIHLGPQEVFLQFAPISFDAATLEIWGSLLHGARLVLFPSQQASLPALAQTIQESGVTVLWLTAGLFHQIVENHLHAFGNVRHLLAGGDVVSPQHVSRVLQEIEGIGLSNGYGPTENTTFTCCHFMEEATQVDAPLPIGRPIANTQVYILDRHLHPVPVGITGELYIGGDGLARGYLHRPDLTAASFVPHPFSDKPGARLYKTGDLVRYRPDGCIDFLGRNDFQVKVRGFRIELGEIEAALAQHPAVQKVLVVARGTQAGEKQLVAYVVSQQKPAPETAVLRDFLRGTLPGYMIPSLFVILDAFPLTANGKVDRRALPSPQRAQVIKNELVAPSTPFEEILAEIWQELLEIERVGIHDNFFELGGHSLLATQVVSRVHDRFEIDVPLRTLFEAPTIAVMASRIEEILVAEIEALDEEEAQALLHN